jgi:putative oxidoreductase
MHPEGEDYGYSRLVGAHAVDIADHDRPFVSRTWDAKKFLGFPPSSNPGPSLFSLLGLQGIIELVGGVLIVIGLFTRPVAFILAGDMAVAYFMRHAPRDFFPLVNMGQLAILFCFVFLYLFIAGGGAWSIDQRHASRS